MTDDEIWWSKIKRAIWRERVRELVRRETPSRMVRLEHVMWDVEGDRFYPVPPQSR